MAREFVTHIWCDVCLEQDDIRTEGSETPAITIGNMKPRVLALCDTHMKEHYEPVKQMLQELGQPVDLPVQRSHRSDRVEEGEEMECPYPGCTGYGPYRLKSSLRNHFKDVHGTTLVEWEATQGGEVKPSAKIPEEFVCGVEGCDVAYDPAVYNRASQAIGMHRAKAHGIAGTSKKKSKKKVHA